jgi:hypothetical protein
MKVCDIFIYSVIGFILIVCISNMVNSDILNLKCVISTVDGNQYCVRNRTRIKEASDLLATVTNKCTKLVNYLHEKFPEDDRCIRLYDNFRADRIMETLPTSSLKAYSENKGTKIAFCLNKKEKDNEVLIDENTLTFVALHELSHLMTSSIGHDTDFWENFKFILTHAIAINLYVPVNYKTKPTEYCGMNITDNPYYDLKSV